MLLFLPIKLIFLQPSLLYSPPDLNKNITEIFGKLINIYRGETCYFAVNAYIDTFIHTLMYIYIHTYIYVIIL